MSSGTDLAAKIDTIIFGDGEVVGPNSTHFDTEIQNRKMAATGLAKQLRNAMARGEDPKVTLNRIMESEPSRSDTLAFWQRRYARMMLLRFPRNFDGQLAATEKLPEPPNFFRK